MTLTPTGTLAEPKATPEQPTPAIAVLLYTLGAISILVGILAGFSAIADKLAADAQIACAGVIGGSLLLGFGYALRKLAQIEAHLNPGQRP